MTMSLRILTVVLALVLVTSGAGANWPTDADRREFAKLVASGAVKIDHPDVLAATVEDSAFIVQVAAIRLTIRGPLDDDRLDEIAKVADKAAAPFFDLVGVRFVLPGYAGSAGRDPEIGPPFYAWRKLSYREIDYRSMLGLPEHALEQQAKALSLARDQKLVGFWVDHYYLNAAVALIDNGQREPELIFLFDPATHYFLKNLPMRGGERVDALREVSPQGTFKCGTETDALALKLEGGQFAVDLYWQQRDRCGWTALGDHEALVATPPVAFTRSLRRR